MARRLFRTTGFEPCRSEMVLTERGAEELHRHRDKERSDSGRKPSTKFLALSQKARRSVSSSYALPVPVGPSFFNATGRKCVANNTRMHTPARRKTDT